MARVPVLMTAPYLRNRMKLMSWPAPLAMALFTAEIRALSPASAAGAVEPAGCCGSFGLSISGGSYLSQAAEGSGYSVNGRLREVYPNHSNGYVNQIAPESR